MNLQGSQYRGSSIGNEMKRIVIAGGGFAGLYTALQLTKFGTLLPEARTWSPEVTLIDRQERFVFTPLLYELVSREMELWEVAPRFDEILRGTGITFIQGEVSGLDLTEQQVVLSDGMMIPYEQLVIGVGGRTPTEIVPGAQAFALPFRTLAHAQELIRKLEQWEQEERQDIRIAIVGGGASGVELGCKLADRLGKRALITLIEREPEILHEITPELRSIGLREVHKREITLQLGASVERIEAGQLFWHSATQPTRPLTTDLVLWTIGTRPATLLDTLDLKKDRIGRLLTQQTLQLADFPNIFALGDNATSQQNLPVTAQVAFQQADYCAWNLWAQGVGLPLLDFRYTSLGQLISLGIDSAAAELLGVTVEGSVAANLRRLVYSARMPGISQQAKVGFNWLTQPFKSLLPVKP